jgi:mRNA-degrading endonuclease toxin of MazEF toxin-antitoxin module
VLIQRGDLFWLEPGGGEGSSPADGHPQVVVQDDVLNLSALTTRIGALSEIRVEEILAGLRFQQTFQSGR